MSSPIGNNTALSVSNEPTFIRKDEHFKYELNKLGLQKFLLNRDSYYEKLVESVSRLKNRLPSDNHVLQGYVFDWEGLLEKDDVSLATVILGDGDYSKEMRQNSPFSAIVTSDERKKVLKMVFPDEI